MSVKKNIPNPSSTLLNKAIVSGYGLCNEAPEGFAQITLIVPESLIVGQSPLEIQSDLGLPWSDEEGNGLWFEDVMKQ